MTATANLPTWLAGLWNREWIERAGTRSSPFDVNYLQTPSAFADIRIPRDRPALAHARSFADLTDAELHALARQRGFAGFTTVAGDLATWHHEIDFQPPDSSADVGRLEQIDDSHMLEHALDSSYTESWRMIERGTGQYLVLRLEHAKRLERILLVSADRFIYARNRGKDLEVAESLDSLIASSNATRAEIIAYVDCELSVGRVRGGAVPWEIQHSTLPWHEGHHLDLADSISVDHRLADPLIRVGSGDGWLVAMNTLRANALDSMFAPTK
ncbi:MAG: hypothetical protein ABI889_12370 [Gemmatimonadota bacterium]